MTAPQQNVRDVALEALRDRWGNVSAHLERRADALGLTGSDRALARELSLGVVRRRRTVWEVLRAFLKDPNRKLPTPLREVLCLGAYQILFLDRVPDFAAVNEAVAQAIRLRHRRQSGMVNGVLRNIARGARRHGGAPPLAREVVPVGRGEYCSLDRPVFADPAERAAEFLAQAFSLPDELATRWLDRAGSLPAAAELAMQANVRPPIVLRVNRLRADVRRVLDSLAAGGAEAHPHANEHSVVLGERANVTELAAFRDGWVQPQDPTATAVGLAARPQPGWRVLDLCAAPGTKTTHLAELMDNHGEIVAADVSREKIERIESNCRRLGVSIVRTILAQDVGGLQPESFDLVLADVPCSNTGVLARRAEARWRFGREQLARLSADQRTLALMAGQFVRPGGRLVYSTCSIEPEECSEVVAALRRRLARLTLLDEQLTVPGGGEGLADWHDGGYYAILENR